jgi:hypothetical protein
MKHQAEQALVLQEEGVCVKTELIQENVVMVL